MNRHYKIFIIIMLFGVVQSCTPFIRYASNTKTSASSDTEVISHSPSTDNEIITGKASYYANKFHGRKTASGVKYNKNEMTAAHKSLPFGTIVKVTNIGNNKSVVVTINDRGPFVAGRIIDLSRAAAEEIDMIRKGVVNVEVEILSKP